MRRYTIKVFFTDGTSLSVDCDDFITVENSHYYAVRDDLQIMTFPFKSVKYAVTSMN